jgi:hypothetical protein
MNKPEFVKQLKEIAETLKPLTESVTLGGSSWNAPRMPKAGRQKHLMPMHLLGGQFLQRQPSWLIIKKLRFRKGKLLTLIGYCLEAWAA